MAVRIAPEFLGENAPLRAGSLPRARCWCARSSANSGHGVPVGRSFARGIAADVGRLRQQFELRQAATTLAIRGAVQSLPVSPPPITITSLPVARIWFATASP